jgi:integrase
MPEWTITKFRGEFAVTWFEHIDGRKIRRRYSLGTSDRKQAERNAPSRYAQLTRTKGTTVADIWEAYREDIKGRPTAQTMKYTGKPIQAFFPDKEATDITIADCRAYTAYRRGLGRSDGAINTELGHLAIAVNWAKKNRIITTAPAIEKPAKPEPKQDYLTRDEVDRILASEIAPHIDTAIRLLIGTGARMTAALELTWDRVDFERNLINLKNPFDRSRRKGRAVVPMNENLAEHLKQAKYLSLSPYVVEFAGEPVKSIKRGLTTAGAQIGRKNTGSHIFRHSAAVWLAENGHKMEEIAQFLGHSNLSITYKTYARYSPDHLRTLADTLSL